VFEVKSGVEPEFAGGVINENLDFVF